MEELFNDLMNNPEYNTVEALYAQYDKIMDKINELATDIDTYKEWCATLVQISTKRRLEMIK